jgi:hypothetical protein
MCVEGERESKKHTHTQAHARTFTILLQATIHERSSVDDKEQTKKERRKTLEMATLLLCIHRQAAKKERKERRRSAVLQWFIDRERIRE